MQHRYFDVSNLNAPYDNVPLMGLGQYGGGVFGRGMGASGNLGSLGAALGGVSSVDAGGDGRAWQTAMNTFLKSQDRVQLTVDGKLGKGTCGAAQWILNTGKDLPEDTASALHAVLVKCDVNEVNKPWNEPAKVGSGGGVTTAPPPPPSTKKPDEKSPYTYTKSGSGGATWWIVGGLVVAAGAIGVAMYMRK